jgi:hypothetical protein
MDAKELTDKFQCSGCIVGSSTGCGSYKKASDHDGCESHSSGTTVLGMGKILLGFPKGFNRLNQMPGERSTTSVELYEKLGDDKFNVYNVPVWKLRHEGAVFVRGLRPRVGFSFIMVFPWLTLAEYETINCHEITKEEFEYMD